MYLKLDNEWKDTASQIGLYFFDDSTNNFWGTLQTPKGGVYLDYTYSLDFSPTKCIAMRVKAGTTNWGSNIWDNDDLYARTGDLDISTNDFIYLGSYSSGKYTNASTYSPAGHVYGGAYKNWTETTITKDFKDHLKVTNNGDLEVYGEVELNKCSFKVEFDNIWSQTWSCHDSLKSIFDDAVSGNGNIDLSEGGKYTLYYNVVSENVYITTAALAAADEFAQSFLDKTSTYCNGEISSDVLLSLKGEYQALAPIEGAQALFYGATVTRGQAADYDYGSFCNNAISRYVHMQENMGYSDFLGLGEHNPIEANRVVPFARNSSNNNYMPVIIIIASSIAIVSLLGAGLIIKRKKEAR